MTSSRSSPFVKQLNNLLEAPKALEKAERHRIIREADRNSSRRNYAIITLLLNTGIRLSELVSLDWDDVDISNRKGTLRIRNGKGKMERTIPLCPPAGQGEQGAHHSVDHSC